MNLVKFKDIYLDSDNLPTGIDLTPEEVDFFNANLKSRYAYALNWQWVIPFSEMDMSDYIEGSKNNSPGTAQNIVLDKISLLIDEPITDRVNSVVKYEYLNQFTSDDNITLEELKQFRTWLAKTLLNIKDSDDMIKGEQEMLYYYSNNMYDSTIGNLSIFSTIEPQYSVLGTSTCGCTNTTSLSSLSVSGSVCDPIYLYRKGIYDFMVKLWSDYTYWTDLESEEFLSDFKRYIDGIISYNLPLYTSDWTSVFNDCNCVNSADSLQTAGIAAMKNLSQALGYMITGDITGHKNFINNSLYVFTTQYYEMMFWN